MKHPYPNAIMAGLFLAGLFPAVVSAAELSPRDIMERVINRDKGNDKTSDMEMVLIDKRGSQRVRKIRGYHQKSEKRSDSILFFLDPADVKNTAFLTYDYKQQGVDDDQWLYLPALRKTKRIAGGDQSGSFMGSDFNYSDMTEPNIADFVYKKQGEPVVEGEKTWQIEAIPINKEVESDTGYSKSVMFVRQDNFVPIRSVSWVSRSRKMKFMKVAKLSQIEGIWVVMESQMATKEGRTTIHSTYLRNSNIRFSQNLPKEIFSVRQLEKGLPRP
jgi:hypothetical protein